MAKFVITGPDGAKYQINAPDDATEEQVLAYAQSQFTPPDGKKRETSVLQDAAQGAGDLLAGAVRGAGSIGATLLAPIDIAKDALAGKGLSLESNQERRAAMDAALQGMGADPEAFLYKAGKLGGEIAGTAGAGGAIARGVSSIPALARFAPVIESGGFGLGNAASNSALANTAMRVGGGAIQGGAQALMVDPEHALTGAAIGAVSPVAVKAAGVAGDKVRQGLETVSKKLMQSALKPTIEQLRTGKAAVAVDTLLDEGLNATRGGVEKLKGRIADIDDEVSRRIAESSATINKQKVAEALNDTRSRFANQVAPTSDMAAIDAIESQFLTHPQLVGEEIPVQLAQQLKQGTYSVLKKKYGQMGSADTEAQKALARGLKEGISGAVPEVAGLNARESRLLSALLVAERRALMDQNKNPLGLAALAGSPAGVGAFLADRSALLKSLLARGVHGTAQLAPEQMPQLIQQHGLYGAPSVFATSP